MPHVLAKDLRNAVLQAAMEGKLTERLSSDSSVLDLISAIAKEKEALIKQGKVEKAKKLPAILEDDIPFEIPETWTWERWGNLSNSIQYGANAGAQASGNAKLVRISDIQGNKVVWSTVPFCVVNDKDIEAYLLNENDILFARTGGTVGKSVIVRGIPNDGNKYIFAGYLIRSNYSSKINFQYLKYFMESQLYWDQLREGTIGSAQPNCNGKTLSKMMIPLPPVEEQSRIVARLDELMAKIDEYEKIENELTALHKKFPADMKAAILQEAFSGNLTERNADDSSVDKYLLESQKKRLEYEQAYKEKKHNALWESGDFEAPFDIPGEWRWAYVGDVFRHNAGKALNAKNTVGTKRKYITTSNVYADHFELNNLKEMYYTDDEVDKYSVHKGDLLVLEGGDYGRTALWNLDESYCIQNHLHRLRPFYGGNIQYYFYLLTFYKEAGYIKGKGIGIQGLSANALHNIIIPIPPVEEQARIVEKLNQLLPLCDQLEQMAA